MRKYLLSSLILITFMIVPLYAEDIPSCYHVTEKRSLPGSSPNCAPPIIDNHTAFQFINELKGEKINYDWYFFISEDELRTFPYNLRWNSLLLAVSAIQSLYGENADVYLALPPRTEYEELMLMLGQYPTHRIVGRAMYIVPADLFDSSEEEGIFPKGHHKRLYKLIVY